MKSLKELKDDKQGLMEVVDIVLALVLIVVVGAIGIYIADKTLTATNMNPTMLNHSDAANRTSNANLTEMQWNLVGAGQTGSSFIIILIIASIGGLAIAYLLSMVGKRKGGV